MCSSDLFRFDQQKENKELAFYVYHMIEKTGEQEVTWIKLRNNALRYYHPEKAEKGNSLDVKSKWIYEDIYGNKGVDDFRQKVVSLLQSQRVLKIIRNVFNHGNSNYRVSLSKLKKFIENYISDLRKTGK